MLKTNLFIFALLSATLVLTMCNACSTTRSSLSKGSNDKDIKQILYYGTLAGNSHNTQPWRAKILDDNSFELHADTSRKLKVVDDSGRGLYISLGAFIENCVQAASALGYRAEVQYIADNPGDRIAARLSFSKVGRKDESILSRIENRITLRTPYLRDPLRAQDLNALMSEGSIFLHYYPLSEEKGRYISQQSLAAYSQQARDAKAKDELAQWIRFSNKDVSKKRDGLTTAGMGIGGVAGVFVSNFMKPEDSKSDSFVEQGIKKTEAQVNNCAGWILISQPQDSPRTWMETGRIYQRINLKCRELSIGCHPVNALIEEDNFECECAKKIGTKGKVQMILRVGYVKSYPAPVSVRRKVEDIIVP